MGGRRTNGPARAQRRYFVLPPASTSSSSPVTKRTSSDSSQSAAVVESVISMLLVVLVPFSCNARPSWAIARRIVNVPECRSTFVLRARPGRDGLAQVVPPTGDRVLPDVDGDPERAAGQLLDRPARSSARPPGCRHVEQDTRASHHERLHERSYAIMGPEKALVRYVGAAGFEPATARV